MNKRAIELYTQALDFAYNKIGKEHAGKGFFEAAVAGTFAEMIVKECAKFLDENSGYDESNNSWHPESEDLLKHFGVEK
jgi:hypothetical protein